jgi:hypothetical protein
VPRLGEAHATAVPHQQLHAELVFELGHVAAERRAAAVPSCLGVVSCACASSGLCPAAVAPRIRRGVDQRRRTR